MKLADQKQAHIADFYGESFYENQVAEALGSARMYVKHLWSVFQPASVLDVGCGRGAWLKACHELGTCKLVGFDGDWNEQSLMIDSAIEFRALTLTNLFQFQKKLILP
jgi:2-polyprenyl-3-methyl-5-hydroxy-6-metoxy-1,4-benzoquinol methylase